MSEVFKGIVIKNHHVVCNPDGELVGKWGKGNMHTMTHQSVLLGIPAMQIEFPRSLRNLLIKEKTLVTALATCILDTYEQFVVPHWQTKKTELILNYSLSKQLQETKLNFDKLKGLAEEYEEWDKTPDEPVI